MPYGAGLLCLEMGERRRLGSYAYNFSGAGNLDPSRVAGVVVAPSPTAPAISSTAATGERLDLHDPIEVQAYPLAFRKVQGERFQLE